MALPKVTTPLYTVKIPSTGKSVTYRAFLNKEEKILMLAMQSEDVEQINMSLKQIVTNCTEGTVNPEVAPMYDIEFLFLNIIAKSVGEEMNLNVICENCQEEIAYKLNIYDIAIPVPVKGADIVKFSDTLGIKLKYPTIDTYDYVGVILDETGTQNEEMVYDAIAELAEYIFDGDGVYYLKDQTKEEIHDFFDQLNGTQMDNIRKFFIDMPSVSETIEFKCSHCDHDNKYIAKGIHELFI